jgi:hypothetical protein
VKKREGLRVVEIAVVLVSINLLLAGILKGWIRTWRRSKPAI